MSINVEKIPLEKLINNRFFDNHENVYYFSHQETKLEGFLAIYNTNLGNAVGGTRTMDYSSKDEALNDALRLSKAMSYKCALANLPYGGGKVVITDVEEQIITKLEDENEY